MRPQIIKGNFHQDARGILRFNNVFDMQSIKRMYTIENVDSDFIRGWQGHQIEQRWFSPIAGSFKIKLIEPNNWENPSRNLPVLEFVLNAESLDVLHVPPGFISSIQATAPNSKLLVFSDYALGEISDECKFPQDYFN